MNIFKSIFVSIGIIVFLFLPLAGVSTAHACSCIMPRSPAEELRDSAAVFSGTVISIEKDATDLGYNVKFSVQKVWKGITEENILIRTALDSAGCGFEFKAGGEYVVYAYESEGTLNTSLCSRTHLAIENDPEASALGAWTAPTQSGGEGNATSPDKTADKSTGKTIAIVAGILIVAGVVYKIAVSPKK